MVSPQQAELPLVTATGTKPENVRATEVSPVTTVTSVNIKSASNPLLPFIDEDTVKAITSHTKEKGLFSNLSG